MTLCLPCCYKDEIISLNFDYKNCTILIGSKRNCITVNAKGCFISDELSKCTKSYFAKMSKSIVRDLDGCCRVTRDDKCCITAFGVFCDKYYLTYKLNNKLYLAELFNGNLITVYYITQSKVSLFELLYRILTHYIHHLNRRMNFRVILNFSVYLH